jgi:YEATS family
MALDYFIIVKIKYFVFSKILAQFVNQDKGNKDGRHNIKGIISWGGGVGGPVLIAILVIVFTPMGEQIRNYLFPSSAVVEGSIYQEMEIPAPKAKLDLDNKTHVWTDALGNFFFQEVPAGPHSFWIYDSSSNPLVGPITFVIAEGELSKNLGKILLNSIQPKAQQAPAGSDNDTLPLTSPEIDREPTFSANMTASSSREPTFSANMTASSSDTATGEDEISLMHKAEFIRSPSIYNVTVWIVADPRTLSEIEKVTYYLHPTLKPDIITRYSAEDRFTLSFAAWGQFTIGAKVFFNDGNVIPITKFLSFL